MRAVCLTCWPKALYGLEAPYGVERPRMTRAPCAGDELCELEGDPRLSDAGRTEDGDEVTPPLVDDSLPRAGEHAELAIAADHGHGRRGAFSDGRGGTKGQPRLHRSVLPLRDDRLRRPVLDGAARSDVRLLADEHGPDRRRRLEARCGVDDVPRDEGLAAFGARVEGNDRLARVHRHAQLESLLLGPVANREGGADCSFGVVTEGDGGAEHAHHCVADELLHLAAVALELAGGRARSTG